MTTTNRRPDWMRTLICPECGARKLDLSVSAEDHFGISSASIKCTHCPSVFTVSDGVYDLNSNGHEQTGQGGETWRAAEFASLIPESGLYRTHAEWLEKKLGYPRNVARLVSDYESVCAKGRILELLETTDADTVVDLGCGVGYLSFDLMKRGPNSPAEIICMDILPEHVRFVRQRQVEEGASCILPLVANAERIPLESASVKAVMGAEIMEHVPNPPECAREIFRILKPGGQVILSTPNHGPYERFHRVRLFVRKVLGMGPGPSEDFFDSPLTPERLSAIFRDAGFKITRLEYSIKVPIAKRLFMILPERAANGLVHLLERVLSGRLFGVSMLIEARKPQSGA